MTPIELAKASRTAYSQHTHESGDSQAAMSMTDRESVIAFRGTQKDFGDILTDLRAMPWHNSKLKAWCHAGFLKSTLALYDVMAPDIYALTATSRPIHFTGHSLGGAQATIMACLLRASGLVPAKQLSLACFGPPPAQYGRGLNKWLDGVDVRLYRNGGDCVTRHPLLGSHVRPLIEIGPIGDDAHRFLDHRINDYIYNLKGTT